MCVSMFIVQIKQNKLEFSLIGGFAPTIATELTEYFEAFKIVS